MKTTMRIAMLGAVFAIAAGSHAALADSKVFVPQGHSYSPDQERIFSSDTGGGILVWEAETGKQLLRINSGSESYDLRYDPESRELSARINWDCDEVVWPATQWRVE